MKTTLTVLLLCILGLGQTSIISAPLQYTVGPNMRVTLQNLGPRVVVAYVVDVIGKNKLTRDEHDFFFKTHEFHPGDTWDVDITSDGEDPNLNTYQVKIVWCQFLDGTEWGDKNMGADILQQRADKEALLNSLNTADDTTFVRLINERLSAKRRNNASALLAYTLNLSIKNGDFPGAHAKVDEFLKAASARHATGNF